MNVLDEYVERGTAAYLEALRTPEGRSALQEEVIEFVWMCPFVRRAEALGRVLQERMTGTQISRNEIVRVLALDVKHGGPHFDHFRSRSLYIPRDHTATGAIIYREIHDFVRLRIKTELRPLLSLPTDVADAARRVDTKASLARRGKTRFALINELISKAKNDLLDTLSDAEKLEGLKRVVNDSWSRGGMTQQEKVADMLTERVLPETLSRSFVLQILQSDDKVAKEELTTSSIADYASGAIARALETAIEPMLHLFEEELAEISALRDEAEFEPGVGDEEYVHRLDW